MKTRLVVLLLLTASIATAQTILPIYPGKAPGSEKWDWSEAETHSDLWQTRVVYNVSTPTLTAYLPVRYANGTAVIICPGGAFHALSIDSEGIEVAKWLNSKGVAAFVLKYRLVKSETSDPVKEVSAKMASGMKFDEDSERVIPLAISDGLQAVRYLRQHAAEFNLDPERIGIMGFSAGGTVAAGVVLEGKGETRPNFVAPVYAYLPPSMRDPKVPENAPPMFITVASDDELGLASHSVTLYNKWLEGGKSAEMHVFAKGGHGFGMRKQYLPSDSWIQRYGDWLESQGLLRSRQMENVDPRELIRRRLEREERARNDWPNLSRYKEENAKLGPPKPGENRIVFMGNSITEGWSRLRPEFFANKPYVNRGISGQTTPQMLIRFKQDVIDLKPKVVVILAGINDIAQNTGPTTPEAIMDNLSGMALLAKANGIKVILCSVLPAYDFPWKPGLEPAEKVVELNKLIKEFAVKNNIHYVDYYSATVDSRKGMKKEYASDEVHPTVEGYKVMEPLVEKAIATVLKSK